MEQNLLWVDVPGANLKEQAEQLRELVRADPEAAAIAAEEAETFMAAVCAFQELGDAHIREMGRLFGIRVSHGGPKARRWAIVQVMRRWNAPKVREQILHFLSRTSPKGCPAPLERPSAWTDELLAREVQRGTNLIWLAWIRRYVGRADDLQDWLRGLRNGARGRHWVYVNMGRLVMRRLLAPQPDAAPDMAEVAAASQADLTEELREKDRAAGTLRQNARRLEQDRSRLKERARRAELEARALLPQARGEVAAARRALKERLAAQERELAEQERQFQAQAASIQAQMTGARDEFIRVLSDRAAHSPLTLLAGRTVTVTGKPDRQEIDRLLVESLGGRFAPDGGEVTIPAPPTFVGLDRQLRSLALERVLIKCDGLYRRKGDRPGVAVSAFQVWLGRELAGQHGRTVCCGPMAGSLMAEYGAVVMALSWLVAAGPPPGAKLEIWSDCRVLVGRLRRPQPSRHTPGCIMLDVRARSLLRRLRQQGCDVRLRWVPRDNVYTVDRLCDVAYRGLTWYHRRTGARPRAPLSAFMNSITPRRNGDNLST